MDKILIGTRIPRGFFETKGTGESDIAVHAGSYHLALKNAGIERCNIMTYSSILPGIAEKNNNFIKEQMTHGCVLESIMSVCNAKAGQICTAGIIYGWLYNKNTNEKYGGLVCEHQDNITAEKIELRLRSSLNELYINGFSEDYELKDINVIIESFIPKKIYGTALVSICFYDYVVPIL